MQDGRGALAVAGVDRRRQVGEAVGGELDVELAHGAALVPGGGRRRGLVAADSAQGLEGPLWVGGDHLQDRLAVLVDQPFGARLTDVAQAGQVGDLALAVGGVERQRPDRPQLAPVARVGLPLAAHFGAVAGAEVGDRADQREALAEAGAGLLHLEHGVAVVLGFEDDAEHLDRAAVGGGVGVEERGGRAHLSQSSQRSGGRPGVACAAVASGTEIGSAGAHLAEKAGRARWTPAARVRGRGEHR